ncbi:MAG: hypothetical protein O2782_20545, partial [bacterium]|nr:hypothetical protein [bacterium]
METQIRRVTNLGMHQGRLQRRIVTKGLCYGGADIIGVGLYLRECGADVSAPTGDALAIDTVEGFAHTLGAAHPAAG